MATTNQKIAFNKTCENIRKSQKINMGEILLQSGYAPSVAKHPDIITKSKGWQELLAKIDDEKIIDRFNEIVESDDKRSAISAGIELLKLKDRYPANKTKITAWKEESEGLLE